MNPVLLRFLAPTSSLTVEHTNYASKLIHVPNLEQAEEKIGYFLGLGVEDKEKKSKLS